MWTGRLELSDLQEEMPILGDVKWTNSGISPAERQGISHRRCTSPFGKQPLTNTITTHKSLNDPKSMSHWQQKPSRPLTKPLTKTIFTLKSFHDPRFTVRAIDEPLTQKLYSLKSHSTIQHVRAIDSPHKDYFHPSSSHFTIRKVRSIDTPRAVGQGHEHTMPDNTNSHSVLMSRLSMHTIRWSVV